MESIIHALNISWSALNKVRAEVRDDISLEKSMIKFASMSGSADGPCERMERSSSHKDLTNEQLLSTGHETLKIAMR